MKNVAIITGGPSAERSISLKSAGLIEAHLDPSKYTFRTIVVDDDGWYENSTRTRLDLNDFSLTIGEKRETFDFAFLMIHGTPAEDGKIQGYLELMGISHSTCDTLSSALTFNKQVCKEYLRPFDIDMAPSVILNTPSEIAKAEKIEIPVIVKPNKNGSSYGVAKVDAKEDLSEAVRAAFEFDDEVMVEGYIQGREFGCGVLSEKGKLHAFPITEIIPAEGKDFFDYEAKYEGKSQEITPAELDKKQTQEMQNISKRLYGLLRCKGVVRFDFILQENKFYLLEANTIPGMSPASIVPQQARADGWTIGYLLDVIVEECMG